MLALFWLQEEQPATQNSAAQQLEMLLRELNRVPSFRKASHLTLSGKQ
jgi:hypothetical protein